MPAGVTWSRYLTFFAASMLTMLAGAQAVHVVYRPLDDMDAWIESARAKSKHQQKEVEQSAEKT